VYPSPSLNNENAGMSDCTASGQSGTGINKLPMPEAVRYRNEGIHESGTEMLRGLSCWVSEYRRYCPRCRCPEFAYNTGANSGDPEANAADNVCNFEANGWNTGDFNCNTGAIEAGGLNNVTIG
jgi:hypothetical protein